jgi:hypothetical protein
MGKCSTHELLSQSPYSRNIKGIKKKTGNIVLTDMAIVLNESLSVAKGK